VNILVKRILERRTLARRLPHLRFALGPAGGVSATYTQPGTGNSGSISLTASSSATLVSGQTITITASGSGVTSVTATFSLTT
jgi:hypothetical protein